MKKTTRRIIYILILGFIILQFFQPEKNLGERDVPEDLFNTVSVDKDVRDILETSCYDCHSNFTNYPWYSNISPVSIFLNKHIVNGKKELNFSEWGNYSDRDKISRLVDIYEAIESGEMPLQSYLIIHKDAALDDEAIDKVLTWTENEGEILFKMN
ncbi:MAG: heme-binding domain-containing protein [Bacteroidales bacterium]|nr:heme-binding domain-containing protein [Bacteroidales bacterium]